MLLLPYLKEGVSEACLLMKNLRVVVADRTSTEFPIEGFVQHRNYISVVAGSVLGEDPRTHLFIILEFVDPILRIDDILVQFVLNFLDTFDDVVFHDVLHFNYGQVVVLRIPLVLRRTL